MIVFEELGIDIGYVLLGTMGVVLILLILLIVNMVKHSKLKKKYNQFMEGQDAKSLENVIQTRFGEIDKMKERMFAVDEHLEGIDNFLLKTFKKFSIVRYDAFREMGGNLSFVLVCLTETNDGFVLNTINSSREGCYTYAKNIVNGQCDTTLSEEESQALQDAMKK